MSNTTNITSTSDAIKITDLMKPGNTAVVTGSSSGIGRAAALTFALKGMDVWMIDVDADELKQAQSFVKSEGGSDVNIMAEILDVSDAKALETVAAKVFSSGHKNCNILMNNAGIANGGGAIDTPIDTVRKTMDVNLYGVINGVQAFVPKMKESEQPGIVINTGSKQGITMPPGNLTYNMSKAALKCFTEGLEHELMKERRSDSGGKLRAALLVPGWTNTSIALKLEREKAPDKSKFDPDSVFFHEDKPAAGAWMPQQVVDFMISEIDAGRFYVICPDNDVDRQTDNLRMAWTMQDITEDRPPLSRWHPDYKDKFTEYVEQNKKKE